MQRFQAANFEAGVDELNNLLNSDCRGLASLKDVLISQNSDALRSAAAITVSDTLAALHRSFDIHSEGGGYSEIVAALQDFQNPSSFAGILRAALETCQYSSTSLLTLLM